MTSVLLSVQTDDKYNWLVTLMAKQYQHEKKRHMSWWYFGALMSDDEVQAYLTSRGFF